MASSAKSDSHFTSSNKLEDQAASAALYVTRDTGSKQTSHPLLDSDGKLSSAGAATSLKYARAQDLPSFPSPGLKLSSAGAAASLADSNKKSFQHWKPGALPAAQKAAYEAKDYHMDPLWQPELSAAGSKAAIQAHRDPTNIEIWKASDSEHGQSAAGQAFGKKPPGPITERDISSDGHRKALLAATASMSGSRKRADSAPIRPQQDASWALKAANRSQKGPGPGPTPMPRPFGSGDPGFEAARLQNMAKNTVPRQMYGSAPPVAIEVEEKNRQAMLRASAVAMAQKMYAIQQSHIDEAKNARKSDSHYAANKVHRRTTSDSSSQIVEEPIATPRYHNLEEAARKLAQERLAKLHDEDAEYREYYGQNPPTRSRLSMRFRRRASSDGLLDEADEDQARKIRSQMSIFQSKYDEVDSKKRQSDRDALMAAAQRNVTAKMASMDDKVFDETGKTSPHQREVWEKEATARAQKDSDERMVNHGKVHIGGGKYLDQSEIDAIARARLQPTLDEISEKAAAQRARDEEIRLEKERIQREAEAEKTKVAQAKAEQRLAAQKEKSDEKARKTEEKKVLKEAAAVQKEQANAEREKMRAEAATEKERLRTEAAAEKERLRVEKEEQRKPKETKVAAVGDVLAVAAAGGTGFGGGAPVLGAEGSAAEAAPTSEPAEAVIATPQPGGTVHDLTTMPRSEDDDGVTETKFVTSLPGEEGWKEEESPISPKAEKEESANMATGTDEPLTFGVSPTKSDSKVKSWFKSRFRSASKTQNDSDAKPPALPEAPLTTKTTEDDIEGEKSTSSIRDVAMAGRTTTNETEDLYGSSKAVGVGDTAAPKPASKSPSISSMSSSGFSQEDAKSNPSQAEAPRGRSGFKEKAPGEPTPPNEPNPELKQIKSSNEAEEDDYEEAKDTFDEGKLVPQPKLPTMVAGGDRAGPKTGASPRGSKDRGKFTEDL